MRGRRAVVLLSGGLDSAVVATIAKCERYELHALTVDYGQRNHDLEVAAAQRVARALRAKEHRIVALPLADLARSALTDGSIAVPKNRSKPERERGIPSTYVPARNTILLALGLAYAETVDAEALFIGAHAVDYSGYPDCRPEFLDKFGELAALATKRGVEGDPVKIMAPMVAWSKAKIVETGHDLKAPMKHTWSCYEQGPAPCGSCDACLIRKEAFAQAGISDPALEPAALER